MPSRTIKRLTQRIKERAAHVILHEMNDPRMGFVTVTRVTLTDDISLCRVYYSVMGKPAEVSKTRHALESARGFIQKRIAEGLRTRVVPHVELLLDESLEEVMRVSELLRKLSAERNAGEKTPSEDATPGPDASDSH